MNTKLSVFLYTLLFSGLGVFSYLLLITYTNLTQSFTDILYSIGAVIFFVVAFNILGFSTIKLSSWINNQYSLYIAKRWKIVAIYGTVTFMLFLLNYGLLVCAKLLVRAEYPFTFPNGGIRILIVVWLVELVILGLLIAYKSIQNTLKLQQQASDLQQENNIARYTALQNQLNPHFLFNSLNTLIAEIEYEPKSAIVFTRNLSNVYRYVLQCQERLLVTLNEELEFVKSYLFLHEVRLGDCIKYNNIVPENYMESMLPPLTLQLLIENIIKHNAITAVKPISIDISVENSTLIVSNTINQRKTAHSSGIGLKNLSNRCYLMLGHEISVVNDENVFTVKIPLLYE